MQPTSKRAFYIASIITAVMSALSLGVTLLVGYVLTSEIFLMMLPGFVLLCDFLTMIAVAVALTVIFSTDGVKRAIAASLLPLFTFFLFSLILTVIEKFIGGTSDTLIDIIINGASGALVSTLLFLLNIFGAVLVCVATVYFKSGKKEARKRISLEIAGASAVRLDSATGIGLFCIPLLLFLVELIREIIDTVSFFYQYFDSFRPGELIYMSVYYLYLIALFVLGIFVAQVIKDKITKAE